MSMIGERLQAQTRERSGMVQAGETRGLGQERAAPRVDSRGLDAIAAIHFEDGLEKGYVSGVASANAAAQVQQRFAMQNVAVEVVIQVAEQLEREVRVATAGLDSASRPTRADVHRAFLDAVGRTVADAQSFVEEIRAGRVDL